MTTRVPATTLTTAADALRGEEIDRTRSFVRLGWIVAAAVALAVFAVPGDPRIRTALLAVLGVGVLGSVAVYRQLDDRFRASMLGVVAFAAIVCGQLGILYVGVASAAPLVVALGLYYFCRTESLVFAIVVYAFAAGTHAVDCLLVVTGVIDDPGFYPIKADVSPIAHVAGHAIVQMCYACCFWLARMTRAATLRSIDQLQQATRLAAQRDVQVAELQQDLDRALEIGGPGRFTGHTVGAWTLGHVLGRGAMGEVYEATHATGTPAAVKVLRRELLGEAQHVERFFREVRVAGSLDTPHVVRVLDASTPEDPLPFLAMERLHGKTLGELVRTGPVTGAPLHALVEQVAGVLEKARAAGIVHRDLKPHNLFLHDDGTWKVLDFGIAMLGDGTGTLTKGAVIGTPTYMAPEQARGEPLDHRADLYALGAVIYRCLTGRLPFAGADTPALLYAVVHTMPVRPSALQNVSPQVEAFLSIALAKSRADRFETAAELAAAFADADRGTLGEAYQRRARALLRQRPWRELEEA